MMPQSNIIVVSNIVMEILTLLFITWVYAIILSEPEKAIESFKKAIKLNPEYILARGWIAQIESER